MKLFVGRKEELSKLQDLAKSARPSLVVIKGRRRIGKSSLAAEFGKDKAFFSFSGLAPIEKVTAQDQRNIFAKQLSQHFQLPLITFLDWNDAFSYLSLRLPHGKVVILLDEISWLGTKDHTFLPKLKIWWDQISQLRDDVILMLCGSVSTWIEKNIINSTAFFGRISLSLTLGELSLSESALLLRKLGFKHSAHDMFAILAVTGGVPWYLEQVSIHHTVDENIRRFCFEKDGMLVGEFGRIFHDLFNTNNLIYRRIVTILGEGMRSLAEIRKELGYARSGSLTQYLSSLVTSGFVSQHLTWSIVTSKIGRQSLYRLSDNYIRFYLKYIEPNLLKIQQGGYTKLVLSQLPGWEAIMGFQIENLLLKNRDLIFKSIGLNPQEIVVDNPYMQKATERQRGCQIDYLIQTHSNSLFACEFKFRKRELGNDIIEYMRDKLERFVTPKRFGVCPVLFHFGGVSDTVQCSNYFYRIIDINDFLDDDGE